jgi:quercetin dioxygenase-like cupin family protein
MNTPHRKTLLEAPLGQSPAIARCRMARIELAPGQAAGLHRHPCDVVGYIVSGTIRLQIEGQPEQRLRTGDAFHEPKDTLIPHFDNASRDELAVFIAAYLLPEDEDEVIEML